MFLMYYYRKLQIDIGFGFHLNVLIDFKKINKKVNIFDLDYKFYFILNNF